MQPFISMELHNYPQVWLIVEYHLSKINSAYFNMTRVLV